VRSEVGFQPERGAAGHDAGGEAFRIHVRGRRRPHQLAALGSELGGIAFLVARIARQILVGRKLGRIDEDRHHGVVCPLARLAYELQVAAVQCSHGRNERN